MKTVNIPDDLHRRVKLEAAQAGVSVGVYLLRLIEAGLNFRAEVLKKEAAFDKADKGWASANERITQLTGEIK